jgi:shikimate dehydrogenase
MRTTVPTITPATKLCAVIGNPIAHSMSPAIHNAAFQALGLDYVYVAFRVEDAAAALAGMRALESFRGMSVTIPHKIVAMETVDVLSDRDRRIGSINTVINEGGRLVGLGTDGPGALKALKDAEVSLDGARVLMLGAGGAARAVAFTLAAEAGLGSLVLMDIDTEVLEELVADLREGSGAVIEGQTSTEATVAAEVPRADLVINCSPVGMHPREDATLVPAALMREGQAYFDIVYNPLKTRLLKDAEAKGLKTIPGVEMFVNQAVLQFERFTGEDAPYEVMHEVVVEQLGL